MIKTLLNRFTKPKTGKDILTELDITRVVEVDTEAGSVAEEAADPSQSSNIAEWKQNDLDLLQTCWQSCCDNPHDEAADTAFRNALHNLHGASGAYGGGALTRLSGSLHILVSSLEDLQTDAALINLHVQACRATAVSDGSGADEVAGAVCDALESQVNDRLRAA